MLKHLINITQANAIIQSMDDEFDSHKFIETFAKRHPDEYRAIRRRYTTDADRKTNALIARFLLANTDSELNITKVEDRKNRSKNIHELITSCAVWRKN